MPRSQSVIVSCILAAGWASKEAHKSWWDFQGKHYYWLTYINSLLRFCQRFWKVLHQKKIFLNWPYNFNLYRCRCWESSKFLQNSIISSKFKNQFHVNYLTMIFTSQLNAHAAACYLSFQPPWTDIATKKGSIWFEG